MKWNFLYQITAASRAPDKWATAPRSPFSLSSVLNWICWTPPLRTKFLGTSLNCISQSFTRIFQQIPVLITRGINRLTPNDPYMGRTTTLTSKRCILYIYSTIIGTEYFKHALYSPFFSLQNAGCFIMLTCLVPVLFTFYIQDVLILKKK